MICVQQTPENYVRIGMSSSYANVINFVLFDIVLATIIFRLTSDIAGLTNVISALSGIKNQIHPNYPSFLGAGLTCTRRNSFRYLAMLRVIALVSVMSTNFLIEGSSCQVVQTSRKRMFVPGALKIPVDADVVDILRPMVRTRTNCAGQENGMTYYGELRADKTCELRRHLFTNHTVFWGNRFVDREIWFPRNCDMDIIVTERYKTIRWRCKGFGKAACMANPFKPNLSKHDIIRTTCHATVKLNNNQGSDLSYWCKAETVQFDNSRLPSSPTMIWRANCRLLLGVDVVHLPWVPNLRHVTFMSSSDIIHLTYVADVAEYNVNTVTEEINHVTDLRYAYFYILGLMMTVIIFLVFCSIHLRCFEGLRPAAHNELGLYCLLKPGKSSLENGKNLSFSITSLSGGGHGSGSVIVLQNYFGTIRARIKRQLENPV